MTQDRFPDTLARTAGPPVLAVVSDSHPGPTLLSEIQPRDRMRLVAHDAGIAARAPADVDVTVGEVTLVDARERAADTDAAVGSLRTDRETLPTELRRTVSTASEPHDR